MSLAVLVPRAVHAMERKKAVAATKALEGHWGKPKRDAMKIGAPTIDEEASAS